MKLGLKGIALGTLLCQLFSPAVPLFSADIYLQIQRGEKVTIGMPDFVSKENAGQELALTKELQDTAQQDILFTHLFNLTGDGPPAGLGQIDFDGWKKNGADILITAHVALKENKIFMIASVFEVETHQPVFQKSYSSAPEFSRRIAHEFISDFLYRFTGDRGIAKSRIAFSNNASGSKEIYIVDYDGSNLKRLTSEKSLAILPRWSPDGKEIIYNSYRRGNPDLYIYSVETNSARVFSARKGLNSAAAYSPDGQTLVATLSHEGSPNLYLLDPKGQILRRLTNGRFADTSPSFSPDGRKIIFVSDRPGWPQIYLMDIDGGNLKRMTDSGYCDSPVWSPRGDLVAYSKGSDRGQHQIFVHNLTTGNTYPLTENAGDNENPAFSPDGRFLVFSSSRNKKRELFISSIDGAVQKKLTETEGDCFTPAWGQ